MKKPCKYCKKIIIEDWDKYLEENTNQKFIQCGYCFNLERIK